MPECIRVFLSRLLAFFRPGRLDEELEDELGFHLEMQTRDNLRNGMNPEEARRSALRSMGGLDQVREKYRDKRSLPFLEDFMRDLRYGLHMLRRNPGFTLAAVLTLALGIGANVAIFSLVNAVLLHPLPFANPEELVQIKADWPGLRLTPYFRGPEFQAFYRHSGNLPEIAAYNITQANLSGREGAERVMVGRASIGFFPLLRVQARIGRVFISGEDQPGAGQVAVLSNGLWKRRFGSDSGVLGRSLLLDGAAYSVVGILPAAFDIPREAAIDIWTPAKLNEKDKYGQGILVKLIGRLKPGSRIQTAQAELDSIYQSLPGSGRTQTQRHIVTTGWEEEISGEARLPLLLFLGTVGFVLLIACANIANLLLARAVTREKEMAIRTAIGARRLRIVRQLLTESLLIALLGGGLGFATAFVARSPLISLVSKNLVRISVVPIDHRVLGFALLISIATAAAVGIAPALHISRIPVGSSLKDGSRSTIGPGFLRARGLFVVLEIALVAVLLTGAGLLLKSLRILQQIDPGFRPGNILTMSIDLTPGRYPNPRAQAAYYERVLDRLKSVPGIESVGVNASLPFGNMVLQGTGIEIEGLSQPTPDNERVYLSPVSHGYFGSMHIPLLYGRLFASSDRENSAPVAIVDKAFVRRYFPGRNPVGRRITVLFKRSWTIVGVAGEVHRTLETNPEPHIYVPYLQSPYPIPLMSIVARCAHDPMKLAGHVRDALKSIDPDQPAFDIMTLEDRLSRSLNRRRANSFVVGSFAALALLLAFIGIYGVVSFSVNRRTHEIGIRMACGAGKGDVLKMILRESMGACLAGLGLGLAGALAATRIISSLLFQVSSIDPPTFAAAFLFVAAAVMAASYIPARRAVTVDPARSLRYE